MMRVPIEKFDELVAKGVTDALERLKELDLSEVEIQILRLGVAQGITELTDHYFPPTDDDILAKLDKSLGDSLRESFNRDLFE
jgi:hypothetical protein